MHRLDACACACASACMYALVQLFSLPRTLAHIKVRSVIAVSPLGCWSDASCEMRTEKDGENNRNRNRNHKEVQTNLKIIPKHFRSKLHAADQQESRWREGEREEGGKREQEQNKEAFTSDCQPGIRSSIHDPPSQSPAVAVQRQIVSRTLFAVPHVNQTLAACETSCHLHLVIR